MFGVVPVAYALGLSFFDTYDMVFWGLENYRFVFGDFRLGQSFVNVATYLSIWLTATVVCVTMLSLMLDTLRQGVANTIRTLYFLPGAVTSSAVVVLWIFMLDPAVSPFGGAYGALGWDTRAVVVSSLGFAGIFAVMAFFASSGGWIVVFGGALSSLSPEVIEAARGRRRTPDAARAAHQAADDLALGRAHGGAVVRGRTATVRGACS